MDAYTKFNAHFQHMVTSLDSFRRSWQDHLIWIQRDSKKIQKQYPDQIDGNTWATKHAVFQALDRLTAIDQQLTIRQSFLAKRNIFSVHITLEHCIVNAMQRPPVSCESRAWQFILAVAEAEDSLQNDQLQLETHERKLSEHIHMMETAIAHVREAVQSEAFPMVCMLHDVAHTFERILIEGSCLGQHDRYAVEDKLDIARRVLNDHRNVEAALLAIAALLSGVGVKIARQRLIPEFFYKVSET